MDNLVSAGAKGIIVSAVDPKNSTAEFDKLAGETALFTTDSDAPQTKRIAYVGSSNILAGEQAADIAKKAMAQGRQVHGLRRPAGRRQTPRERIQGFKQGLQGNRHHARRCPRATTWT